MQQYSSVIHPIMRAFDKMEEKFHFVKSVGFRKVTFNFVEIN